MPKKMTAHRLGYEDGCTFSEEAPAEARELIRSKRFKDDAMETPSLRYIADFVPQVDPASAQAEYNRGWRLGLKTCLRRVTR